MRSTLCAVATDVGGRLVVPQGVQMPLITGVSIDTRTIQAGDLFVPLGGTAQDGHAFVDVAFLHGAVAAFWQQDRGEPPPHPVIVVDDTTVALQRWAKATRQRHAGTFIAITGSNGKTTTKDFIASVLATQYRVHKTQGNYNNELGVPLTLLATPDDAQYVVVEMGMRGIGQIAALSAMTQPHVAVITNIGEAHIAQLGSRENIACAKAEIVTGLLPRGRIVVVAEPLLQPYIQIWETQYDVRTIGGGTYEAQRIVDTRPHETGTFFRLHGISHTFDIPIVGTHHATNALFAIVLGQDAGIPLASIAAGLKHTPLTGMRVEQRRAPNGAMIWNDAYNANPTSVQAAVATAMAQQGYKRKFVILGDMRDLGADAVRWHQEIGQTLCPHDIDYVITYGELAQEISRVAQTRYDAQRVHHFTSIAHLVQWVTAHVHADDLVLIKGSRALQMERIVHAWFAQGNNETT